MPHLIPTFLLQKVWFQNRRAKWRKKEQTRKGPGRPAHNAHPQSCSGEPIPPEELERRERIRQEKKLLKQLERQQKKLALKGIHVTIEQLREEQKARRRDHEAFSEEVSESNSSKCNHDSVEARDTTIRRTTFSIESILGTAGSCEKGPPSPGTLMRGAPTPPLTPRNFSTLPPASPSPSPEDSELPSSESLSSAVAETKDMVLKIPSVGGRRHAAEEHPSREESAASLRLKGDFCSKTVDEVNLPNFSFKTWQSFMPQFLGYETPASKNADADKRSDSGGEPQALIGGGTSTSAEVNFNPTTLSSVSESSVMATPLSATLLHNHFEQQPLNYQRHLFSQSESLLLKKQRQEESLEDSGFLRDTLSDSSRSPLNSVDTTIKKEEDGEEKNNSINMRSFVDIF